MTVTPIWRDYFVNLSSYLSGGKVEYTVWVDNTLVYTGKAYAAPGTSSCVVNLRDIIKGYLRTPGFYPSEDVWACNSVVRLLVKVGSSHIVQDNILNDWSYGAFNPPSNRVFTLGDRVIREGVAGFNHPVTVVGASEFWLKRAGSVVQHDTIETDCATLWLYLPQAGEYTLTCEPSSSSEDEHEEIIIVRDACYPGVLIYLNAYGGFDSLPIASITEREDYKRQTYDTAEDNNFYAEHELRRVFSTGVSRTYTLRTPVLTDEQAARMHHAIGTTRAWLKTPESRFTAVIVKTDTCKRKTFKNEGRKRVVYEFEVEFAQPMERR